MKFNWIWICCKFHFKVPHQFNSKLNASIHVENTIRACIEFSFNCCWLVCAYSIYGPFNSYKCVVKFHYQYQQCEPRITNAQGAQFYVFNVFFVQKKIAAHSLRIRRAMWTQLMKMFNYNYNSFDTLKQISLTKGTYFKSIGRDCIHWQ